MAEAIYAKSSTGLSPIYIARGGRGGNSILLATYYTQDASDVYESAELLDELESFDREGIPVNIRLSDGESFTREEILETEDRDIIITMVSGKGIIDGLTYRIDPDLEG